MTVNHLPAGVDWENDVWPAFKQLLHSGDLDTLDMAQVVFSFSTKNNVMKISAVASKTDAGVNNSYFYKDEEDHTT